jgi:uracil-DNA glycosylase
MKIPSIIHPSWEKILEPAFQNKKMKIVQEAVSKDRSVPATPDKIFRAFSMPLQDVKVVILGQDPYLKRDQATGLAFAVPKDVPKPYSLKVIEAELGHEVDRTLMSWHNQGVLLLNSSLTVRENEPDSHHNYRLGDKTVSLWRWFISHTLKELSKERSLVWLLWGTRARTHLSDIRFQEDHTKGVIGWANHVLTAAHPASERHRPNGFLGCGHFVKANHILKESGKTPIIW